MISPRIEKALQRDAVVEIPSDLDHKVRTQLRNGALQAEPLASPAIAVTLAIAALVGLIVVVGLPLVILYLALCTLATLPLVLHLRRPSNPPRSLS